MGKRELIRFILSILTFIVLPQAFSGCAEKETLDLAEWQELLKDAEMRTYSIDDPVDHDWPEESLTSRSYTGVECALRKARQLADLKWTPLLSVPSCYGSYSRNQVRSGAPYSLAYMTNTQIGTQVSLHTFMTALQNPFSVLYTEDLGGGSYDGPVDSSAYYGTTCSNSVLYVLGIEAPYYARMFAGIPGMKKTADQTPGSVEPCDVLGRQDHVMMVYGVDRDEAGNLRGVQLFETTRVDQKDSWIRELDYEAFEALWKKYSLVRYQYQYLDRNTDYQMSVFVPLGDEPTLEYHYNYALCPTLGDRCSYPEGSDVRMAVYTDSYPEIYLYKDGEFFRKVNAKSPMTEISGLPHGSYRACLVRDNVRSGFTCFEVLDIRVSHDPAARNRVAFGSENASPRYIVFSDSKGRPNHYYSFSDEERATGVFNRNINILDASSHCRVFFRGQYGVVASDLIRL